MPHALHPRAAALGALLVVGTAACSQTPVLTQPRSFDRPGRSSLVCFDVTMSPPRAVPLASCAPADPSVTTLPTGFDLHALVLQSRRGEIAVVQLKSNVILDTNTTIPGYTFVEAGALPIDLVSSRGLSAGQPIMTYVANSGTEDIWVFESNKFRAPATTARAESQRVALGARPSAVVLTPDERFLIVALPTLGVIRQFAIRADGLLGTGTGPAEPAPTFTDFPLLADVPAPLVAEPEAVLYERVCSAATLARPTTAPTRVARVVDPLPAPVVLLADDVTQELLVGDSALPVVHRFSLSATGVVAELAPVAVGTPVYDLALTPFVPSTLDSSDVADRRRYLYALDDTGAVAVIDLSDPVGFPAGRPISVEIPTARSQDRITFAAPATALTMIATRDYDPAAPAPFCGANGPARLHGVFLAASLTDGTVRFIDVYDRDASCRGSAGACAGRTAATGDSVIYIRRHRPRIGSLVSTDVGVLGAPTMSVLGVAYAISTEGTAASNSAPDLALLEASCSSIGPSFVQAFPPDEGNDLICALGDPWAATQERWTATYEGAILSGVAGSFGDCGPVGCEFRAEATDFCRAGVIGQNGAADLPPPPEGIALGDQLVITGDLPPGETREECTSLVRIDLGTSARIVLAFEIMVATEDGMLTIADRTLGEGKLFTQVADCFSELVAFEVRSRGSWVVRGSFSGLVRALPDTDSTGACRVSTTDSEGRIFRAYSNGLFQSRAIAFKIDGSTPPAPGMALTFDVGGLPQTLGVDLTPGTASGSIPVEIFYSVIDNKLYAVDAGRAALTRIAIDNVSTERLFQ